MTSIVSCLNVNRVTISKAKYFGIVTLKVLPTSYFPCNSLIKFTIPETKINRINTSLPLQVLQ